MLCELILRLSSSGRQSSLSSVMSTFSLSSSCAIRVERHSGHIPCACARERARERLDFSFIPCGVTDAGAYLSCIWARQGTPQLIAGPYFEHLGLWYVSQGYLCSALKVYWHLPCYHHTFQISSTVCVLWGLNPAQYPSGLSDWWPWFCIFFCKILFYVSKLTHRGKNQ